MRLICSSRFGWVPFLPCFSLLSRPAEDPAPRSRVWFSPVECSRAALGCHDYSASQKKCFWHQGSYSLYFQSSSSSELSFLVGIEHLIEDISLSSIFFLGFSSRSVLTAPVSDSLHSSSGRETDETQNFICKSSRRCGISLHCGWSGGGVINLSECSTDGKTDRTVNLEVHASKDQWADELSLHLSLQVHKDGGQVPVRVIWDAGGGDGLEELGLRELSGQLIHVLVDEGTQRDAGKEALGSIEQQPRLFKHCTRC